MTTQTSEQPINTASSRFNSTENNIAITQDEFRRFQKWLYEHSGIHMSDVKKTLITGRLNKRLKTIGISSYSQYLDYILSKKDPGAINELQIAVDLLTTNETYFFREQNHFDFIQEKLNTEWKSKPLRYWSAASSSGQEAYSIAMLLAANNVLDWQITGTDISSRVIAAATAGSYPINQAEKIPASYLKSFCLKGVGAHDGTFKISSGIRKRVTFCQANLQKQQSHLGSFDLVLLRNVMIYFDLNAKQKVIDNICQNIKPGGYLLIGHSESLNGIKSAMSMVKPSIYQYQR